jgi:anti-anti-sigma factor
MDVDERMDKEGTMPGSAATAAQCRLAIERRRDADGTVRLILTGALDTAGCGRLCGGLMAERHVSTGVVVVLDQLEYIDSAGVAELLRAGELATRDGRYFAVTPGSANVACVLRITGALDQLRIASDGRGP